MAREAWCHCDQKCFRSSYQTYQAFAGFLFQQISTSKFSCLIFLYFCTNGWEILQYIQVSNLRNSDAKNIMYEIVI